LGQGNIYDITPSPHHSSLNNQRWKPSKGTIFNGYVRFLLTKNTPFLTYSLSESGSTIAGFVGLRSGKRRDAIEVDEQNENWSNDNQVYFIIICIFVNKIKLKSTKKSLLLIGPTIQTHVDEPTWPKTNHHGLHFGGNLFYFMTWYIRMLFDDD